MNKLFPNLGFNRFLINGCSCRKGNAKISFPLGRDKTSCLAVRFLIPPVEHRACDFHRTRRSTFGHSPWGGVSNVDIAGNTALQIKAIGVVISTFETLPK